MNTDNQQVIGIEAKLNWLAGITDGEGCIALLVFKGGERSGTFRLQMRVTIANTDQAIVERIVSIMHEIGVGCHVQHQQCKSKGQDTDKTIGLVHVSTINNLQRLLRTLVPLLVSVDKKQRGEIMLQLIDQRLARAADEGKANKCSYTEADVSLILQFLRLTRSKQIDNLTEFLNEHTREARNAKQQAKPRKSYYISRVDREAAALRELEARYGA